LEILTSKDMFIINRSDISWIGSTPVLRLSVITIFCASAVCITVLWLTEHPALMEWIINAYKVLVGRTEGTSLLRKYRRWWENNIKWYVLQKAISILTGFNWFRIGFSGGMLWIRRRNLGYYKGLRIFFRSSATVSFSRRLCSTVLVWLIRNSFGFRNKSWGTAIRRLKTHVILVVTNCKRR
jgi:hypothetical protein